MKTKFNIGDKVYPISKSSEYYQFEHEHKCPVCKGKWKVIINGYKFQCPHCVSGNIYRFCKVPLKIIGIEIRKTSVAYMLDYKDSDYQNELFSEHNCFSTLEEAKAECEKKNVAMINNRKVN